MAVSGVSLNKKLLQVILISIASVLLIAGCGGGGGSGSVSSTPIMINADSGTPQSLNGSWRGCGSDMTTWFDLIIDYTISGNQMVMDTTPLDSNDGSCTGAATANKSTAGTVTLVSDRDITIQGWTDGNGPVAAPAKLDGNGGYLLDTPVVSGVIWKYTDNGTAYADKNLMYMDDSGGTWCVYESVNPTIYGGADTNGYAQYLLDNPIMCKI